MIDWEARYRELETQLEHMLLRTASVVETLETEARTAKAHELTVSTIIANQPANPTEIVIVANGTDMEYAMCAYTANGDVSKHPYQRSNTFHLSSSTDAIVRIKGFARSRSNRTHTSYKQFRPAVD